MSEGLCVRACRAGDESSIVSVVRTVYDEYGFGWDEDGYHADLYSPLAHFQMPACFLVAEFAGQIVGTGGLDVFPAWPDSAFDIDGLPRIAGTDCSLERLYLLPEYRGRGIGKALLAGVIAHAREHGLSMMEIWSDKRFEAAHTLYRAFGAEHIAERLCNDPDCSPEWGMRLRL
jgi:putative acetyltransferase